MTVKLMPVIVREGIVLEQVILTVRQLLQDVLCTRTVFVQFHFVVMVSGSLTVQGHRLGKFKEVWPIIK